jgi:hypothetical protein
MVLPPGMVKAMGMLTERSVLGSLAIPFGSRESVLPDGLYNE